MILKNKKTNYKQTSCRSKLYQTDKGNQWKNKSYVIVKNWVLSLWGARNFCCIGDCSHCNMTLRRNKGIKIGNEEEKLFAEDIVLITENHKNLPKYLLELIRECNNAV